MERRPRPQPGEACDFCSEPIGEAHRHVVAVDTRQLSCACRACFLLFAHEGAGGGRYRAVPDRYEALGAAFGGADWEALQVPVGIVFFFVNSALGRTVAFYPGPGGATESLLDLRSSAEAAASRLFDRLEPDVEALLVHGRTPGDGCPPGPMECFIVPIDACYELVGRLRRSWRGFDGGDEARGEVDRFFSELRARCHGAAPTEHSMEA